MVKIFLLLISAAGLLAVAALAVEPHAGDTKTIALPEGTSLELVWIPSGMFMMGSSASEFGRDSDERQHEVLITRGFWMGKYEVTQEQYQSVTGTNPSNFEGPRNPVETVNWEKANAFCRKIGARLPTEAEWEYACRAATRTKFYSGDDGRDVKSAGWYEENSCGRTHIVGQHKPNAWGLHDMHGNVYEWCADWYGDYPNDPVTNPTGPASGSKRVLRGGSWFSAARGCRSAGRLSLQPSRFGKDYGFRVVMDP